MKRTILALDIAPLLCTLKPAEWFQSVQDRNVSDCD